MYKLTAKSPTQQPCYSTRDGAGTGQPSHIVDIEALEALKHARQLLCDVVVHAPVLPLGLGGVQVKPRAHAKVPAVRLARPAGTMLCWMQLSEEADLANRSRARNAGRQILWNRTGLHIQAARGCVWSNDGHSQLGRLSLNAALGDHVLIIACQPAQVVDDLQSSTSQWSRRGHTELEKHELGNGEGLRHPQAHCAIHAPEGRRP